MSKRSVYGLKDKIKYFRFTFKKLHSFPNSLSPIHISKKEKKDAEDFFDKVIENAVNFIKTINVESDVFTTKKIIFDGFDILSNGGDYWGQVASKEGKIFRLIKKEVKNDFIDLYKSCLLHGLEEMSLIPAFSVSDYYLEDFPIILEVEKIELDKYNKRSNEMLVKSGAYCLFIQAISNAFGYKLYDPHWNNFSCANNEFKYYDIGSIYPGSDHKEYPIVSTFGYQLLFRQFTSSVLASRSLDGPAIDTFEHIFWLKKFIKYHKCHSSKSVVESIKNIYVRQEFSLIDWFLVFKNIFDIKKLDEFLTFSK